MEDSTIQTPFVVRHHPSSNQTGVATSVAIDVEFNEALDPVTVNTSTVRLRENVGFTFLPGTVSLSSDGKTVTFLSDRLLDPNTRHTFLITGGSSGVKDLEGNAASFGGIFPLNTLRRSFTTGAGEDNLAPQVVSVSPPDGAVEIGFNTSIRVRFNESINPLTIRGDTFLIDDGSNVIVPCAISFSNSDRDVLLVPHAPLAVETLHSMTIDGVEDVAGNAVAHQNTQFTTGIDPDTSAPKVVATAPFNRETNVPVNTVVEIEMDEPIDPGTVNTSNFFVRDDTTFLAVPGAYSVDTSGRVIMFMPDSPLPVNRRHTVLLGIRDLSGNRHTSSPLTFTTDSTEDTIGPQVVEIIPADGLVDIPTNTRVEIEFDESVQATMIEGVKLTEGGVEVPAQRRLSNGNRTLTLTPLLLLAPSAEHAVTVAEVEDRSGNPLGAPVVTTFTTGTSVDIAGPKLETVEPPNGALNVSTTVVARIEFNEPINPLTVTKSFFHIQQTSPNFVTILGTVAVAPDGLSATFTPDTPLLANTPHHIRVFSNIEDLTGNRYSGTSVPSNFTTAP